MRKFQGFTLIELMVTIAILAILAAVGLPAYQDYAVRGRLPEAFGELASMRAKMEQYFLDNRTYADACKAGTVAPLPTSPSFDYECTPAPDATTYTVLAKGKSGTSVAGFTFSIDQSNQRATTAVPSGWTVNSTCWVTRKGGQC